MMLKEKESKVMKDGKDTATMEQKAMLDTAKKTAANVREVLPFGLTIAVTCFGSSHQTFVSIGSSVVLFWFPYAFWHTNSIQFRTSRHAVATLTSVRTNLKVCMFGFSGCHRDAQ